MKHFTFLMIPLNALLPPSEKDWWKQEGLCKLHMPDLPPVFLSLNRGVPPSTLPPSGTKRASITPAAGAGTCTDVCKKENQLNSFKHWMENKCPRFQYAQIHIIWQRQQLCFAPFAAVFTLSTGILCQYLEILGDAGSVTYSLTFLLQGTIKN